MIKKWQIVTASMLLSLLSFKVQANVKFIVDNKPGELVFGYEALCVDKGYSVKASDCAEGMVGNSCPYSDEYVDKCLTPTEWCTANGYGKVASDCVKPEYPYEAKRRNKVQKLPQGQRAGLSGRRLLSGLQRDRNHTGHLGGRLPL
jgi:hypothetical protein